MRVPAAPVELGRARGRSRGWAHRGTRVRTASEDREAGGDAGETARDDAASGQVRNAVVQGHRHLVHARPGELESDLLLEPHGRRGNEDRIEQSGSADPGEEIVRGEDALNVVARGPHAARWQRLDPEPVRPGRSAAK